MEYYEQDFEKDTDLYTRFSKLQWLSRRYFKQRYGDHGPMSDPHRGQGRILTLLKLQPEITQKELSFLLDMRPQSLGEFLVKLEKNGYITRTPSEIDRRVVEIKLTEKGLQETEKVPDRNDIFDCLSEDEQREIGGYIDRMINALHEKIGLDPTESEADWKKREEMRFGHHFDPRFHHGPRGPWGGKIDHLQRMLCHYGERMTPEKTEEK